MMDNQLLSILLALVISFTLFVYLYKESYNYFEANPTVSYVFASFFLAQILYNIIFFILELLFPTILS